MEALEAPALELDASVVPAPDQAAVPEGFIVAMDGTVRIHFLDWGGPAGAPRGGALLVHGLSQTAWVWTPVARRLRSSMRVVAMDLRGHGLSDAPTAGYEPRQLAEDAVAVAEGSGLLAYAGDAGAGRFVLAGHGFGAVVAAWAAAALGDRCAGLVLVDGGFESIPESTGMEPGEWLRAIEEPPEVMRSMAAFLADREAFDPPTWDADQEAAARATVTEVPAGRIIPATRPHAVAACVDAMFTYEPSRTLAAVTAPIVALVAADDEDRTKATALAATNAALIAAGRPPIPAARFPNDGHNLPRYRPAEVTAAILDRSSS